MKQIVREGRMNRVRKVLGSVFLWSLLLLALLSSGCKREPTAEALLRLGRASHARGDVDDPYSLEPLYLRPSSAEEQWTRRHSP